MHYARYMVDDGLYFYMNEIQKLQTGTQSRTILLLHGHKVLSTEAVILREDTEM